jgi:antitoxin (DNA-binding transcriptional repressor) of toxin-antitoxin stability system
MPTSDYSSKAQISVDQVARNWPGILRRVAAGETLVIVQGSQPVARVEPFPTASVGLRPYGLCAGEFVVPDDFDAPLPDELVGAFEGRL